MLFICLERVYGPVCELPHEIRNIILTILIKMKNLQVFFPIISSLSLLRRHKRPDQGRNKKIRQIRQYLPRVLKGQTLSPFLPACPPFSPHSTLFHFAPPPPE